MFSLIIFLFLETKIYAEAYNVQLHAHVKHICTIPIINTFLDV